MKKFALLRKAAMGTACFALLALAPATAAIAAAQPAKIQLNVSSQATVGNLARLAATLSDTAGNGVPGVRVTFSESLSFLNNSGTVVVGRAMSNAQGQAVLDYVPRSHGVIRITAQAEGVSTTLEATASLTVSPGPAQFERQETGISVPGANMWFLAVVLGGIWGVFLWAIVQVRAVAKQGHTENSSR